MTMHTKETIREWLWSIMGHWVFGDIQVKFDSFETFKLVRDFIRS